MQNAVVILNRSASHRDDRNRAPPRSFQLFPRFSSAFLKVYASASVASARYWFATRESTRGMTFAASTAPSLLLHPPFVSPLNYLRALRDWPTNPVRLNNLPIIRGPLCFIRRVSNKSHCVFRRAASNSIRVRTRTLSAYPASKKKKRRRSEETEEEATGEIAKGAIAHDSHELTRNSAEHREFMTKPRRRAISPYILHNARAHKYC